MGGIPDIRINGQSIQEIGVNGTGINFIGTRQIYNPNIRVLGTNAIAGTRIWVQNPSASVPQAPPVTIRAGSPIVDMPGCVKVHKENSKTQNRNKMLVNDDPKGNTVLCDNGMPYFQPANYDARELSWQTIYQPQEEVDEGVPIEPDAPPTPDTPEPPPTGGDKQEDPDCPPPNARRIGDVNTAQTEKVSGFELQIDKNNPDGPKICVTLWEDIGTVEKFLPSIPVVSTTATIAAVATTSALLAKPLADLLLKVVKPIVKKVLTKVQTMIGKTPTRPTLAEIRTNQYREKKGMLPINFGKKKKPLKKTDPPN